MKKSFGFELEWGNVDKHVVIPETLGCWEGGGNHSEVDIINENSDGEFIPAWPTERWGGEINVAPTMTVDDTVNKIASLHCLLYKNDFGKIRVTPISNGHAHGYHEAFKDIEVLKKLYAFVLRNQDVIINYWLSLDELPEIKQSLAYHASAYRYMRNDGGKRLSANFKKPVNDAKTVEEFARAIVPHAKESGNILWARAGRQGINLHSLRHTGTVEFRCMKASDNIDEIEGQLLFVEDFMERVVNDQSDYTMTEMQKFKKPPIDPDGLFAQERWKNGLNLWWNTREERKKAGVKKRVGNMEIQ
jgi:hypothetical protein